MSTTTLAAAVLSTIVHLAPPERARALPGHEETIEQRTARYVSIAEDVAAVAANHHEATLILAVAFHESGFAHDVDTGRCYRGPGWEKRCDAGRAVCLMQLQLPAKQRELARTDRRECLRIGLQHVKRSLGICRRSIPEHRFAGLSGSCSRGLAASRRIFALQRRVDGVLRAATLRQEKPAS